jgi:hypothetical protein
VTQRWQHTANQLDEQERWQIIEIFNQEEFHNQSPKQIVPALADRGSAWLQRAAFSVY